MVGDGGAASMTLFFGRRNIAVAGVGVPNIRIMIGGMVAQTLAELLEFNVCHDK